MISLRDQIYSLLYKLDNIKTCSVGVYLMQGCNRICIYNINNINFKITFTKTETGYSTIDVNNTVVESDIHSLLIQANIKESELNAIKSFVWLNNTWEVVQSVYKRENYDSL